MQSLSLLLERYKHLKPHGSEVRSVLSEVIEEECGIPVSCDQIRYRNTVAYISAPSVLKSEILLQKESILTHTLSRLTEEVLSDIQ